MIVEEMERRFFELKGKLDVGAISEADFKAEIEKLKFEDSHGHWWMIGAQSGKWYTFDGTRWLPGKPPVEPPLPPPPTAPAVQEIPSTPVPPPAAPTEQVTPIPTPAPPPPAAQEMPAPAAPSAQVSPPAAVPSTVEPVLPEIPTAPSAQYEPPAGPTSVPLPSQALYAEPEPSEGVPPLAPPPLPEHLVHPTAPPSEPTAPQYVRRAPAMAAPPAPQQLRRSPSGLALPQLPGPVIIISAAVFAIVVVLCMWLAIDNFVPGKPISAFFAGLGGGKPTAGLTPTPAAGSAAAPRDMTTLVAMGDQLLLQSNVDSAITQYQSAAQVAPSSPIPLTHWSRALAYKGLMQDALDKARQAVQRAPNDAEANAQLCRALTWNGQGNDAIAAGEKAVQLDPKNANARAFLAEAYLLARRLPDAQSQAQTALQLAPQSAEAFRAQAWVLTVEGQKDTALGAWQQTVTLEPNFYFRHFALAEALRTYFGSSADAVPEYQKSIALYGAYVPAISRLGMALVDTGQAQDAELLLQRAITLDPQNVDGYVYLGIAFGKQNQCAQAIPYFEQALKIDANNSLAQRGLADCKSGKTPSAPTPSPPNVPLVPPTLVPPNP